MTSNELNVLFWTLFNESLEYCSLPKFDLIKASQAKKTGRLDTCYYYDSRPVNNHGWQYRKYHINGDSAGHKERQIYEIEFSITAYSSDESMTADDMAINAQMAINNLWFVERMQSKGVGVQRSTSPVSIDIINEHDDYERESTIKFIATITKEISLKTPALQSLKPKEIRGI